MPALYAHTTRAPGLILTANIYNADHENHISNGVPAQHDDYSATVAQMQAQTNPGEQGSESQATTTAGELERLRFMLAEHGDKTYWYESPLAGLDGLALGVWS